MPGRHHITVQSWSDGDGGWAPPTLAFPQDDCLKSTLDSDGIRPHPKKFLPPYLISPAIFNHHNQR